MTPTLKISLLGVAFLLTIIHAVFPKVPIWIAVLLIILAFLAK